MADCAKCGMPIQGRAVSRKIEVGSYSTSEGTTVTKYENAFMHPQCAQQLDNKEYWRIFFAIIIFVAFVIYLLNSK